MTFFLSGCETKASSIKEALVKVLPQELQLKLKVIHPKNDDFKYQVSRCIAWAMYKHRQRYIKEWLDVVVKFYHEEKTYIKEFALDPLNNFEDLFGGLADICEYEERLRFANLRIKPLEIELSMLRGFLTLEENQTVDKKALILLARAFKATLRFGFKHLPWITSKIWAKIRLGDTARSFNYTSEDHKLNNIRERFVRCWPPIVHDVAKRPLLKNDRVKLEADLYQNFEFKIEKGLDLLFATKDFLADFAKSPKPEEILIDLFKELLVMREYVAKLDHAHYQKVSDDIAARLKNDGMAQQPALAYLNAQDLVVQLAEVRKQLNVLPDPWEPVD